MKKITMKTMMALGAFLIVSSSFGQDTTKNPMPDTTKPVPTDTAINAAKVDSITAINAAKVDSINTRMSNYSIITPNTIVWKATNMELLNNRTRKMQEIEKKEA